MFNILVTLSFIIASSYALVDEKYPETELATKRGLSYYGNPIEYEADNFTDLIGNSKVFLDNSNIIDEIIERRNHPNYITIIGPDNWGKSTTMDIIKSFFQLNFQGEEGKKIPREETEAYRLFVKQEVVYPNGRIQKLKNPLLISNNSLHMRFQGMHPVIHVSFKDAVGDNATVIKEKMYAAVRKAFEPFPFVPPMLKIYRVRESLQYLCDRIRDHIHELHMVIILIEDYDTPILNFLQNDLQPKEDMYEIYRFLKDLIPYTFYLRDHDDCCLFRGIVTSRFSFEYHEYDEQFFIINKTTTMDDYFGFSHKIVTELFDKMKMDEKLVQKAFEWYGGYESHISNQSFYNPLAIAKFARARKLGLYSKNITDYNFLQDLFKRYPPIVDEILLVISKQPVVVEDQFTLDFEYKPQIRNALAIPKKPQHYPKTFESVKFFTFLLHDGVLVKIPETNQAKLINKEMTLLLADHLVSHHNRKYRINESLLRKTTNCLQDFITGSVSSTEELQKSLSDLYNNSFSKGVDIDDALHSVFKSVLLEMQIVSKFDIDVYYNKTKQADYVTVHNELGVGVLIELQYNSTAQNALASAKKYENVFKSFANLRRAKLLGVNIKEDHLAEVLVETITDK